MRFFSSHGKFTQGLTRICDYIRYQNGNTKVGFLDEVRESEGGRGWMWSALNTLKKLAESWDSEWGYLNDAVKKNCPIFFLCASNWTMTRMPTQQPQCHFGMVDQYPSPLKHKTTAACMTTTWSRLQMSFCSKASSNKIDTTKNTEPTLLLLLQSYNKPGPISRGLNPKK